MCVYNIYNTFIQLITTIYEIFTIEQKTDTNIDYKIFPETHRYRKRKTRNKKTLSNEKEKTTSQIFPYYVSKLENKVNQKPHGETKIKKLKLKNR